MATQSSTVIEQREAEHWDGVARRITDDELRRSLPSTQFELGRLAMMGDLKGKHALDVGCGAGEWTCQIAAAGATVASIDISPEMVTITGRRAALLGLANRVEAQVMSAMRLEYPDGTFDIVHGQDIIHHLEPAVFGGEIARVLKPGGVAVFWENNGNNALLMAARNLLCGRFGIPKWSSDDEYPLTPNRLREFSQHFSKTRIEYPEFVMFWFIDAKFFRYKVPFVTRTVHLMDRFLGRVPGVRRFSYRQLIACTR